MTSLLFRSGAVLLALMLAPLPARAQVGAYLDYEDLSDALEAVADASPAAERRSIGTTLGGREIWLIEVAAPGGTPAIERPGVLVVGNLEGDHVVGSQLALEMARYLLRDDPAMVAMRADTVFYIVPRLNPDGAEAMFGTPLVARHVNARPFDDDNDGRVDEDPPEDLNGDGLITVMRVPDLRGRYALDADDPRFLVDADPAQRRAAAYVVHTEGVDSDGDGFLNEDGPGGVDLNRNFQHEYPYYGPGAGPHMVSEIESRALMDFVIAHRNIAAILTFGLSDNLVTPPDRDGELADPRTIALDEQAQVDWDELFGTGVYAANSPTGGLDLRGAQPGADNDPDSGRRPVVVVDRQDIEYFAAVSEVYREATGIERVGVGREAEGAFFQYGYYQFGVPSFSTQGWALPEASEDDAGDTASGSASDSDQAVVVSALEDAGIDAFVEWTPFTHPDLGPVEIGGLRPYAATNPPAGQVPALGTAHGEFLVALAGLLPRVRIADTEVEPHGGGLYTVSVEVENAGFFPTALRQGVVSGAVDPVSVRIGVDQANLVTGDDLTATVQTLPGSGARERFSWLVRGADGQAIEIRARSQKGGTDVTTVTLGGQ